jgi:XTP/dITP diphosphohydrolase
MPGRASQLLREEVELADFEGANVFFVFGYPRSDIGKGTLVAHMLRMLEDSDAIKFDGILNTNANGRHTARGHDDFGIYEKYNPEKRFSDERYILGGSFYKDFIETYGEYENLTFRHHVAKYFITTLHKMWSDIGKPRNLMVEIGGLITDYEVDPYITPAVRELKGKLGKRCKVVLLSELGYNSKYVKTKVIQDAVSAFLQRTIKPDIIVAREPIEMGDVAFEDRIGIERTIGDKLAENIGMRFDNVLSVPFFPQDKIDEYGDFLDVYLKPILSSQERVKEIFIGSNNRNKQDDWRVFVSGAYDIITPQSLGVKLDVPEGITSIEENSLSKAKAWCRVSGRVTIADDTGFYIKELKGKPGVAVRYWAGVLPEDTTDGEFFEYLKKQVMPLEDTSCYFKTVATVAFPDGRTHQVTHITEGVIDKALLEKGYTSGYPLGLVFKKSGRDKVWAEMSDEEKRVSDRELAQRVLGLIGNALF